MAQLKILISGGGIGGPCLAWWLKRRIDASITIVERAPEPRTTGQAVDIREAAVDIIQRMGLEEEIKSKHTTEEGIEFVYLDGKTKALFPATGDPNNQGVTSEYEILRGDLARIFYDVTNDDVEYAYDEYVKDLKEQDNGKMKVTFANRLPEAEYDLVVGADGMISNTRRIMFGKGPNENDFLKRLGQYCSFFTIPRIGTDTKVAQWYNAAKGRFAFTRPDPYGTTRAYLAVTDGDLKRFERIGKAMREGPEAQKKWLEDEFVGAGWQTERLIDGMKTSKDFYMQEIAQVKLEQFAKGRFALLGDAGYAPSPLAAMGTSAAIVGAYVLAGELSKSPSNIPEAVQRYQSVLKPFVDGIQNIPPGVPQIAVPQSDLAVKVLNSVTGVASYGIVRKFFSGVLKLASLAPDRSWKPPKYSELET